MTCHATVSAASRAADTTEIAIYRERMEEQIRDAALLKNELRRALIATRTARSAQDRAAAARANAAHLAELLAGTAVVCAYLPLASEPLPYEFLDALLLAGSTVLVPVVSADAPLDWCIHPGPTAPGAFGIAEPTGPRLGAAAVATADAILVPALAVDRAGRRLGRGGGHYDRTLALLDSKTPELIAVLFDGELLNDVPTDTHDRPVTAAVTPTGGIQRFRS